MTESSIHAARAIRGGRRSHIFKTQGRWWILVKDGTPQWERQLARQHAARLNGEI